MPRCSQEPVSQLPSRRAGARSCTRARTHEFAPAQAGGGCATPGLGGAAGEESVGGRAVSQASFSVPIRVYSRAGLFLLPNLFRGTFPFLWFLGPDPSTQESPDLTLGEAAMVGLGGGLEWGALLAACHSRITAWGAHGACLPSLRTRAREKRGKADRLPRRGSRSAPIPLAQLSDTPGLSQAGRGSCGIPRVGLPGPPARACQVGQLGHPHPTREARALSSALCGLHCTD